MTRLFSSLALAVVMAVPTVTISHPHVFVTGGAHVALDGEGRLARLHVTWIYDTFSSLYLLNYLQADADGDQVLTEEDKKKILADQTNWPDEFEGDSYLFLSGAKLALGRAENPDTRVLETGQVEVTFERAVTEPFRPEAGGPDAIVKLYDPNFYYSYEVTEPPEILAAQDHGCEIQHSVPNTDDDPGLAALQVELSALGKEEQPEQQDVGALFAEEIRLSCG
jgi:ABC-type uncharacterized transport system substrate-binding protein